MSIPTKTTGLIAAAALALEGCGGSGVAPMVEPDRAKYWPLICVGGGSSDCTNKLIGAQQLPGAGITENDSWDGRYAAVYGEPVKPREPSGSFVGNVSIIAEDGRKFKGTKFTASYEGESVRVSLSVGLGTDFQGPNVFRGEWNPVDASGRFDFSVEGYQDKGVVQGKGAFFEPAGKYLGFVFEGHVDGTNVLGATVGARVSATPWN